MTLPAFIKPVFLNTFRGIAWHEHVPGSSEFAMSDDGGRATRLIDVNWNDQYAAVEAWLGSAEVKTATLGGGSIRYLSRTIPHCNPDYQWLFAQSIPRIEGVGSRAKQNRPVPPELLQEKSACDTALYEIARMTVNYTAQEYEILPDPSVLTNQTVGATSMLLPDDATLKRYITRICRPSGRMLTIHRGLMRWSDGTPIPEGIGKAVSTLQMTYIWHQVPREGIPLQAIQQQIGTVNKAAFDTDFLNFPAGSLLFESVDFRPIKIPRNRQVTSRGFDVQYGFRYEPKYDTVSTPGTVIVRGWNYEYRVILVPPAPALDARACLVPQEVRSSWSSGPGIPDGNHPYEESNFSLLFRPDQP